MRVPDVLGERGLLRNDSRGAALVEFAIAIPIFLALIALIFDAGVGFSASRESSSAARSAARVAALAGESRLADYEALRAIKATYGDGTTGEIVRQVTIYLSDSSGDGSVPAGCGYDAASGSAGASVTGVCNVYDASDLAALSEAQFSGTAVVSGETVCNASSPDAAWCPLTRRDDEGDNLGVAVWTTHEATVGLGASDFELNDRAVFAMYFQPLPQPVATPVP